MELHKAELTATVSARAPVGEIIIAPLGDIQYGAEGCSVSQLEAHVAWIVKNKAWVLGMGDYGDYASPSNRERLRDSSLHDSTEDSLDAAARFNLEELKDILAPLKGRCLGLLEGHHFWEFVVDEKLQTTDQLLAQALGAPFLGSCAMINIRFGDSKQSCTIWCHHGVGGGLTVAAPLNRLERVVSHFDADVYLMAHQHKIVAAPVDRLYGTWYRREPRIQQRRKILACTGSFLQGYRAGSRRRGRPQGSYVEKRMLSPTALGGILIKVRPTEEDGEPVLDMRVEL